MRKPGRNPDPLVRFPLQARGHVVGYDLSEGGRPLADVEDEIDHVAVHGPHQLAHVRVPLKVQAPNRAGSGEALVGLPELYVPHEWRQRRGLEIALAVEFGEIAPVVAKTS